MPEAAAPLLVVHQAPAAAPAPAPAPGGAERSAPRPSGPAARLARSRLARGRGGRRDRRRDRGGSPALIGFGADSLVEGLAGIVVLWRFAAARAASEEAERRAQRLIGASFVLIAAYVAVEAVRALLGGHEPDASWVGIALSVATLVTRPPLAVATERLGARLGSAATTGEGRQNMLCAYLSAALLVGLVANAALGWWWADPSRRC
jgi:hypothetical protein